MCSEYIIIFRSHYLILVYFFTQEIIDSLVTIPSLPKKAQIFIHKELANFLHEFA